MFLVEEFLWWVRPTVVQGRTRTACVVGYVECVENIWLALPTLQIGDTPQE